MKLRKSDILISTLFSLIFIALVSACSSSSGNSPGTGTTTPYPTSASCDTQNVSGSLFGECRDWSDPNGRTDFTVSCNGISGTYSTSACATSNLVGSCTLAPVLGVTAIYRYYSPTWATGSAQGNCSTLSGTFQ